MNKGTKQSYNGYEVLLYPLSYINITGTPESSNHIITNPKIANSGLWDNGITNGINQPLFAPCTMRCVYSNNSNSQAGGHTQMWVSSNKVWIPQSDEPVYATMAFSHSQSLLYGVGQTVEQGTHFYNTGTFGYVTGPHVHMILAIDQRSAMFPTGQNASYGSIWYSPDAPETIATFFYIAGDENQVNNRGLEFKTFNGSPIEENRFKWWMSKAAIKRRNYE